MLGIWGAALIRRLGNLSLIPAARIDSRMCVGALTPINAVSALKLLVLIVISSPSDSAAFN
jgi:hypothetical protein